MRRECEALNEKARKASPSRNGRVMNDFMRPLDSYISHTDLQEDRPHSMSDPLRVLNEPQTGVSVLRRWRKGGRDRAKAIYLCIAAAGGLSETDKWTAADGSIRAVELSRMA